MNDEAPKAKRFRIGWWTPIGVLLAVGGAVLLMQFVSPKPDPLIETIRISEAATLNKPGGATESAIERLKRTLSKPDYYLVVVTDAGNLTTEVYQNTPIGNGLTFHLPQKAPLSSISEVRVMHDSLLTDPIVDRVDVSDSQHEGQLFMFQLQWYPTDSLRWEVPMVAGWLLVGVGCLLVFSTVVRFVWQQVV